VLTGLVFSKKVNNSSAMSGCATFNPPAAAAQKKPAEYAGLCVVSSQEKSI
jgi:hypothetical protein